MAFGTSTLSDLQASLGSTLTLFQIGLERVGDEIARLAAVHNQMTNNLLGEFAIKTTDQGEAYGGNDTMVMEEADEFGVPYAQKVATGSNVGFPLKNYVIGIQWTEMWARKATTADLAMELDGVFTADTQNITRAMKKAFMEATNYTSVDRFQKKKINIDVKRLVNADSAIIPAGPNGESFNAATHTHYLARAGGALAVADLDALLATIREHYDSGQIVIYINQAQEDTVSGFTGFRAYPYQNEVLPSTSAYATGKFLDPVNFYNRDIGMYKGAEIRVRSWVPASYLFATNLDAPKFLAYRYDPDYGDLLGLILADGTPAVYPWNSRGWRRLFGVGVRNRVNGALMYSGNTSWADPTIS